MLSLSVKIHTFGCQMNVLDAELMREALLAAEYEIVDDENKAQVIIFNTCAVREHAEERVLQRVRQVTNKAAIIVVAGCLAERYGEKLLALLSSVRVVCGTRHFPQIVDLITRAWYGEKKVLALGVCEEKSAGVFSAHERARHLGMHGYISVMRGCDNFCTYCIVPYVRGREESRPLKEIISEAQNLAQRGVAEITLLGQNIDAYGKHQQTNLAQLLKTLDDEIPPTVKRFRFVTNHPRDITRELLEVIATRSRLVKHLHVPAQSGSNKILEKMRRGYTREMYDEFLRLTRTIVPDAFITSDFMVGFSGESEDDFSATVDLLQSANFQHTFVFKYSPRPGTYAAENFPDDIADATKKMRNQILLQTQTALSYPQRQSLIGKVFEVLVEGISPRDELRLCGRTINNFNVVFPRTETIHAGDLVKIKIIKATAVTLYGEALFID